MEAQQAQYSRRRMSDNMTAVPLDVIFDILSRLPVKTLIRFRPVCKAWYALIENPNFVKKHKEIQSSIEFDPTFSAMLVIFNGPGYTKKCRILHFNENSRKPIYSELPYLSNMKYCKVVGICDGLVCASLCFDNSKLIICNPTTGHFQQVPPFKSEIQVKDKIFLGFSLHDNGYELRMIIYSPGDSNSPVIRAELYNMGTDIWITIEVKLGKGHSLAKLCRDCDHHENIVIDEIFYWKDRDTRGNRYIISFDMRNEVFDVIDVLWVETELSWQLMAIGGQLAMILYHCSKWFDLWVLNEDMTWTMTCKFSFTEVQISPVKKKGVFRVLGSTTKRELVLENRDEGSVKLLLYNFYSQKITCLHDVDVDDGDLTESGYLFTGFGGVTESAYLYTESLTSVN